MIHKNVVHRGTPMEKAMERKLLLVALPKKCAQHNLGFKVGSLAILYWL